MTEQKGETAQVCPHGCADLVTGEPQRIALANPSHPADGYYCPSCWQPVYPPADPPEANDPVFWLGSDR